MTTLLNFWTPAVRDVETENARKTSIYNSSIDDESDEDDEFTSAISVLYFIVSKAQWNGNVDKYCTDSGKIRMYSKPPLIRMGEQCFPVEIGEAVVECVNKESKITHGKIGPGNFPVFDAQNVITRLRNSTHLLVAVVLHDYNEVFANFGQKFYTVSETRKSSFTIDVDQVCSMKMFLHRELDKRKDLCAAFPIDLEVKGKTKSARPSATHTVCTPTTDEILAELKKQITTDQHRETMTNLVASK